MFLAVSVKYNPVVQQASGPVSVARDIDQCQQMTLTTPQSSSSCGFDGKALSLHA